MPNENDNNNSNSGNNSSSESNRPTPPLRDTNTYIEKGEKTDQEKR